MSYRIIPSQTKARTHAYKLTPDFSDNWNKRDSQTTALCLNLTMFETYGDGTCQHSGDWLPTRDAMCDVWLSLAVALAAEPLAPDWKPLHYRCQALPRSIAFAHSVQFKDDGKLRYYNLADHKVSTADKRHDRRWEVVPQWANGTPAAAWRLLTTPHRDWIDWLTLASEIQRYYHDYTDYGHTSLHYIIPELKHVPDEWASAWDAFRTARLAVTRLAEVQHACNIVIARHQPEPAAQAA